MGRVAKRLNWRHHVRRKELELRRWGETVEVGRQTEYLGGFKVQANRSRIEGNTTVD